MPYINPGALLLLGWLFLVALYLYLELAFSPRRRPDETLPPSEPSPAGESDGS